MSTTGGTVMSNPLTVTAPEGLPFIEFEREFDAPPAAVLHAHADPQLVQQWMGPNGYAMTIDTWDFTSHGRYRYVHHAPDGDYAFRGTFHTVRSDFLVQTFEYEGVPDVVAVETVALEPIDGGARTLLRGHSTYPSVEARDGMVGAGMERGMSEGYERLDGLLA